MEDTGFRTLTLSATVGLHLRVTAAGALASATDQDVGVVTRAGVSGDAVAVSLRTKPGTHRAIAASALAVGALVYTAASGKVNDTQATGSFLRGIAMTAAGADGDVIEVMPLCGDTAGA